MQSALNAAREREELYHSFDGSQASLVWFDPN